MDIPQNIPRSEINNFLTRRLGEKEADELMQYLDSEVQKEVIAKTEASEKQISLWREEMRTVFATKEDAAALQQKLIKRVGKSESTIILWGFVFWLTQLIAVLCFLKFFK